MFDIDGTLIRWQLYHAVTDALARQGHISPSSYQAMRDARMNWKRRSSGSFDTYSIKVIEVYESILKNVSFNQLDEAIEAVFNEYKDQAYTYTRDLIAKLKKDGYFLLAISGSQTEIVAKIAKHYGFDDFAATIYERTRTGFTGAKIVPALKKDSTLKELVAKHGLAYGGSIGVGDSLSDATMLKLVEQPIAFNPDTDFFEYAEREGWKVVVERKNMIYELGSKNGKYQLVKTSA